MFRIEFRDMEWINGPDDDPKDLCSHGEVSVILDDRTLTYACCTSASAMRMLRTLTEDHLMEDSRAGEQMLPCCGHGMLPADEGRQNVFISGCPNGIDYSVVHSDGFVQITTEDGRHYDIPYGEYYRECIRLIDAVEDFYRNCAPKEFEKNELFGDGYIAFWNEWQRRRNDLKNFYFPENNA